MISRLNYMPCPRCQAQNQIIIEQAPDSYQRQARCLACQWTCALKYLNKKKAF